ncbi:MAG: hypothetical protein PHD34_08745 [Methanothrix soehngenii]|jgi:hypothetical protein|nr:hypothetical protein [Methanothrix soehngenii]
MIPTLQTIGLIGGVAGAVLVAGHSPRQRAAGFTAWIIGNGAWVGYAALTSSLALGTQFSIFCLLAVAGLRNNRGMADA